MPTGYQIKEQESLHYLTIQVVDWIDIFTRQVYRDVIVESLIFCQQNKGLHIFGYVIMSNHIHIICNSPDGKLSDIIRDFKKYTSRRILEIIETGNESRKEWMLNRFEFHAQRKSRNENYQFWTHENHAVILYRNKFIQEKLNYMHNNPVRAGIVEKPEEYIYSSAKNYADMQGLIEIIKLDLQWITY